MDEHREEREELAALEREADEYNPPTPEEWARENGLDWFQFAMLEAERWSR